MTSTGGALGINVERFYSCALTVGSKLRQNIVFFEEHAERTIIALSVMRVLAR
jgi:hypothetical protein